MMYNVTRNRGYSEQLQCDLLDGRIYLAIDKYASITR